MFKRFFKSRGNNATANVDPGGDSQDRKQNPTTELLTSAKISAEKVEFALEFVDMLAMLETNLHASDDPEEISHGAMKMACGFYQADWCGFLMVDLDLGLWTPYWWYNTNSQDKTEILTGEYESATKLPRWIAAMQDNTKVMIRDANAIKNEAPEEYEVYDRLKIQSMLAVPVKPRPVGFLAVRNPKRFGDDERMLRMLAYVVLNAINQHSYFESAKMTLTPEGIQSDKDIVFNLFGELEIYTSKGVLREPDCNAPKCCRVIAYLMLNRRSTHPPLEIAATLWPEDQIFSPETVSGNIRGLIYRFRQAFSLISDYPLIESTPNGYRINPELRITTDFQHFDRLWEAVQTATGILQMLACLQAIRNRRMLWSLDVIELNKQISELSSQNQMLTTLKQQGLIDPDIFISQSNELTEQLRAAKLKKERLLVADGDSTIAQTQELIDILEAGPDFLDTFDAELFGELVDKIIVDSNEQLRFRLKNGLELTETIERTVR